MNMMFDARIFEDLSQNLSALGEQFSTSAPRASKDAQVNLMISEARLYAFMTCHSSLSNLLRDIYDKSEISKKEGSDPKNAIGEVLTWFYKERMLTKDQVTTLIEQFDSAPVLSYDSAWLPLPEEKKIFNERYSKISRYYYIMSTFIGALSKKVTFINRRSDDKKA